jgi:hypothetical protein
MKVGIPSVLQSYTGGARQVDAHGATVAAPLPHVRVFVNADAVVDLDRALAPGDEVMILQALSDG